MSFLGPSFLHFAVVRLCEAQPRSIDHRKVGSTKYGSPSLFQTPLIFAVYLDEKITKFTIDDNKKSDATL